MAGNQKNKQQTRLIQKGVDTPAFMNTAKGGKKMAKVSKSRKAHRAGTKHKELPRISLRDTYLK